jgi:hypothetical protein
MDQEQGFVRSSKGKTSTAVALHFAYYNFTKLYNSRPGFELAQGDAGLHTEDGRSGPLNSRFCCC